MNIPSILRHLVSGGLIIFAAAGFAASAREPAKHWTSDGTVTLNTADVPMSEYVSKELRDAYVAHQDAMFTWPVPPALDAPKSEWDRYDAEEKRLVVGPTLNWALKHYPVDVVDTHIAGVHVGIITPKGGVPAKNQSRVLINVHGGAFMMGRGLAMGMAESVPVASTGGFKVVTLDYRQAPYYQFPAASEDVEKVYRELLKTYKPEAIGIYGCSAGGMLSAQSIAWFQSKGLPRPGAVGIFCASAQRFSAKRGDSDMWGPTGSGPLPPHSNVLAPLSSPAAARRAYFATAQPDDPLAYPGVSDAVISKFPPTLFVTGTRAMEMSAAVTSHAQFLRLGVDSQLYVMEAGWHGAFVINGQATPEGKATNAYTARWFDQKLAH